MGIRKSKITPSINVDDMLKKLKSAMKQKLRNWMSIRGSKKYVK